MWLLNTKTLELRNYDNPKGVAYAILSHVWQDSDREYNFQSIKTTYEEYRDSEEGAIVHAPEKIRKFCLLAADEGFDWGWLDTACIDKASSAELSEAINSMYAWYEAAARCYAYLYDVPDYDYPLEADSAFRKSIYHERGWTLQELLASHRVVFLSASWSFLGTKYSLLTPLAERTGIDGDILLRKQSLDGASVAQRMSWAARRVTTRAEDRAYSLMGIFGVAMPIIYGEGGERAFLRLQKEIIATCPDQTIFAWGSIHPDFDTAYDAIQLAQNFTTAGGQVHDVEVMAVETDCSLLAKSPSCFANCAGMRRIDPQQFLKLSGHTVDHGCTFSADGVTLSLPVSSHSMHLRDYTSRRKARVVRAVALACTTASGTSEASIVLLFLSGSPVSLDRWKDLSQHELVADSVGFLAMGEGGREGAGICLHKDGSGESLKWGTFYRGATLNLRGPREPAKDQQPATGMLLDFFRSVRTDFHKRELRIQHPATRIVTFHTGFHISPSALMRELEIPDYAIEIPNWVFHRLDNRYGFIFAPSPDAHWTIHHALHVTRSPGTKFYLLFVNAQHTITLGVMIGASCYDHCRLPYHLRDAISLQVFSAPAVLHPSDTSAIEAALRTNELLPQDSQTKCGRAHLQVERRGQGGEMGHFAFPTGFADEVARSVLHVWCTGSSDVVGSGNTRTRVFNISIDFCHA